MQITEIITDKSMQEIRMHGSTDFPFQYYLDDIHKFVNHYVDWHWHTEFEWIYVQEGIVHCLIESERIVLHPGDGMFINSKIIHRFESPSGALMPNLLYMPEFLAARNTLIFQKYVAPVLTSDLPYSIFRACDGNASSAKLLSLLYSAISISSDDHADPLDVSLATLRLWNYFIKNYAYLFSGQSASGNPLLQARVRQMMKFIFQHYKEKITLTDIANAANISKSEALRSFHLALSTTPINYLIDYRLERAQKLLLTTDDTVTQIALTVGMDNISYFVRAFRKKYGTTPKKFREHFCGIPTDTADSSSPALPQMHD